MSTPTPTQWTEELANETAKRMVREIVAHAWNYMSEFGWRLSKSIIRDELENMDFEMCDCDLWDRLEAGEITEAARDRLWDERMADVVNRAAKVAPAILKPLRDAMAAEKARHRRELARIGREFLKAA